MVIVVTENIITALRSVSKIAAIELVDEIKRFLTKLFTL